MARIQFGRSQARLEDDRFLAGQGRFIADLRFDGQLYAAFARSAEAHGHLDDVETATAAKLPGVKAIYTGEDYRVSGCAPIPCILPLTNVDGTERTDAPHWPLAVDKVRYVGEPVAMVVAETPEAARDGAERVEIKLRALPSITELSRTLDAEAPRLWEDQPSNLAFHWGMGDAVQTEAAFETAPVTVAATLRNNRIHAMPLEPRGAVACPGDDGRLTLHLTSQTINLTHGILAESMFKMPKERLRILTHDIGGGFGMKFFVYPEYAMVLWAADRLGAPVGWMSDRSEALLSDTHARDHLTTASLACNSAGKILAIKADVIANVGAYLSNLVPFVCTEVGNPWITGAYDIPAARVEVKGAYTNTAWIDAYRGAGLPEANYIVERLMDLAARELDMDPAEIRRRNLVQPGAQPYQNAMGQTFSGTDFPSLLDRALDESDWAARRGGTGRQAAGSRRRGIGLACYLQKTEAIEEDHAWIEVTPDGTVHALTGTQSSGQGHETVFAMVVADQLGVPIERVKVIQGDSDRIPTGHGTGGSRSLAAASPAFVYAADNVIEEGRKHAADLLECAESDLEYLDGRYRISGTDREADLFAVAARAHATTGTVLQATGVYRADFAPTFPSGVHVCEVEVDTETGVVRILRYLAVNDFGRVLNPMIVHGQIHGGVAQGIGQALLEDIRYDPDSGQLLSGSLLDYTLPRADDLPNFDITYLEVPQPENPLGIKGCGESGCIVAPPAVVNAVVDAVAPLGVRHVDMPLTPERVWQAMRAARPA